MAELINKFKLMETCEVTKHSAVGNNLREMFLHLGTNNMISMSNPGTLLLPKRIHLLESSASDYKNNILKFSSDTLGKCQNKSSVATIFIAENIYDDSKIS